MSITSIKYPLGYRSKSYTSDNSTFSVYIFKLSSTNVNLTLICCRTIFVINCMKQTFLRNLSAVEFIYAVCMSEVIPAESTVPVLSQFFNNCFKRMGSKLFY